MSWFRNLKIAHKLLLFFITLLILFLSMGFVNYYVSGNLSENIQDMYKYRVTAISTLDECRIMYKEVELLAFKILMATDNKAEILNKKANLEGYNRNIEMYLTKYETLRLDDLEKNWLNQLKEEKTEYDENLNVLYEMVLEGKNKGAKEIYFENGYVNIGNINLLLSLLSDHSKEIAAEDKIKAKRLSKVTEIIIILIPLAGAICIIIFGIFIKNLLSKPINKLYNEIKKVADGDFASLKSKISISSNDEIGVLSQSFNKMSQVIDDYMKKLSEKNELIFNQANHDMLTNLPNRRMIKNMVNEFIENSKFNKCNIALFFIDLDNFKDINDTLGHFWGDELLKIIAKRFQDSCSEHSVIARFGGDEFTIVYFNFDDLEEVKNFARKINEVISKPIFLANNEVLINASIGISIYPRDGENFSELLRAADTAMYQAKKQGKNSFYFYTDELRNSTVKRVELEKKMRKAIDNEEFMLHYQPIIDISSNTICGVEALLRWEDSKKELIFPNEFIPLAEETGLIIPLGNWVLQEATRQNKSWQDEGFDPIVMKVNISPRQFRRMNFVQVLQKKIKEADLNPCWLEIEITEGSLMENTNETINKLNELKELGVIIGIDDFGTGFSSLNYLRHFPVDRLKIDMSFIKGITSNPKDAQITKTIIGLAKSLNLKVVAEGVETVEQLSFLKKLKCNEVQGYLYSKPVTQKDFIKLLSKINLKKE